MDQLWARFVDGRSDVVLFGVSSAVVVTLAFLAGTLVSWLIERRASLRPFKLQPKKQMTGADFRHAIKHVFFHKLTSELPLTFAGYPIFVALGIEAAAPLPSALTVIGTLALAFLVEDAWHYFAHRALHGAWAYRRIHHVHHKYTAPFGPAANYAHPAETLFTGFGTLLAVIVIRPHLFTVLVWIAVRQWQAISVHIGYDFPWRPSRFLPFVGGARFHDRHHEKFTCNYAPTFVWWDRLLGTADERGLGAVQPIGVVAPTQADARD